MKTVKIYNRERFDPNEDYTEYDEVTDPPQIKTKDSGTSSKKRKLPGKEIRHQKAREIQPEE
jgi:hypothetical protein